MLRRTQLVSISINISIASMLLASQNEYSAGTHSCSLDMYLYTALIKIISVNAPSPQFANCSVGTVPLERFTGRRPSLEHAVDYHARCLPHALAVSHGKGTCRGKRVPSWCTGPCAPGGPNTVSLWVHPLSRANYPSVLSCMGVRPRSTPEGPGNCRACRYEARHLSASSLCMSFLLPPHSALVFCVPVNHPLCPLGSRVSFSVFWGVQSQDISSLAFLGCLFLILVCPFWMSGCLAVFPDVLSYLPMWLSVFPLLYRN